MRPVNDIGLWADVCYAALMDGDDGGARHWRLISLWLCGRADHVWLDRRHVLGGRYGRR